MKLFGDLFKKKRIYMDHAATTPLDKDVFSAMENVYKNNYFNPGGLYKEAVLTEKIVSESRRSVAKLLGTTSDHVIFTRGGTESNNMAILGVLVPSPQPSSQREEGAPFPLGRVGDGRIPHVITSEIEHPAVLETLKDLESKKQIELAVISVDEQGIVSVDEIKKALRPETVLVSIMYVNNEIGTIQPIKEITKLVRWYKKNLSPNPSPARRGEQNPYPLVHVDAIQAANYLDINVERLGVDLMSLSGSKIYGPKSSGVLYIRNKDLVSPVFHGGSQEFGLRAGTEDIASIVGFTKALEKTRSISESENTRLLDLQKYFFAELEKGLKGYKVNGFFLPLLEGVPREAGVGVRICNNINISIPNMSSERLVIELDAQGICAASKSACREQDDEESYVIAALRKDRSAHGSIRFTMGRGTTQADISRVVGVLAKIVTKTKAFEGGLTY